VGFSEFSGVSMKGVLRKIIDKVDASKLSKDHIKAKVENAPTHEETGETITHDWLWPRVGHFFEAA